MVLLSTEYPQFMFWLQNNFFFNMHANLKAWIQTTHQTALNDQSDLVFQPNIFFKKMDDLVTLLFR